MKTIVYCEKSHLHGLELITKAREFSETIIALCEDEASAAPAFSAGADEAVILSYMPDDCAQGDAAADAIRAIGADSVLFPATIRGRFLSAWAAAKLETGLTADCTALGVTEDGLLLQALETHPDYRKQGCARKLMEAVQQLLGERTVYSHVSKKNRPSLAVHRRCGFAVHKDSARYLDGSVSANAWTLRWSPTMKK